MKPRKKVPTFNQAWQYGDRSIKKIAGVTFQTPTPLLFQNFWIWLRIRFWMFFTFEKPTSVQTPATIINSTLICPRLYLRNDHTDSCYSRNWNMTPDPVPKEKRRIISELTPVLQCQAKFLTSHHGRMHKVILSRNDQFYLRIWYAEYYSVHACLVWSQKFRLTPVPPLEHHRWSARPRTWAKRRKTTKMIKVTKTKKTCTGGYKKKFQTTFWAKNFNKNIIFK